MVSLSGGLARVRIAGRTLTAVSALAAGSRALACIHPEEVQVALAPGATGEWHEATVVAVTDRGPTLRVDLDCGFPLRALVTRRAAREMALAPGARVAVGLASGSVHLIPGDDAENMAP